MYIIEMTRVNKNKYVIEMTRVNKNKYDSDMLVGKMTTDTKIKTMNYIIDYALANLQIVIDP